MKVISGKYKGRVLKGFDLEGTRPTMDRVKESLFATIQEYIAGTIVLDLFAGSGNLGIESLSQGAIKAYLVDNNVKATNTIKENLNNIGINDYRILNMDYKKALKYLSDQRIKFDLIFLDPPYKTDYIEQSIELISNLDILNSNGLIICESDDLNKIIYPKRYVNVKEKKYGDKWVVILKKVW